MPAALLPCPVQEQQLRKRRKEVGPGSSPASPEQADEHASPVVDTAAAGSPVAATAAAFEGLGSPGQGPVPEEVDEAWAEYRGVVALHRGAELRWQAVFSAALDMEVRGRRHPGRARPLACPFSCWERGPAAPPQLILHVCRLAPGCLPALWHRAGASCELAARWAPWPARPHTWAAGAPFHGRAQAAL